MDVLGYFVLYYASDQGELQNIAVRPGYRGYGIGSSLMEKLVSESLRLGMSQIYLEVRSSNEPAKELYRKYGFIPTGIRKFLQISDRRCYCRDEGPFDTDLEMEYICLMFVC